MQEDILNALRTAQEASSRWETWYASGPAAAEVAALYVAAFDLPAQPGFEGDPDDITRFYFDTLDLWDNRDAPSWWTAAHRHYEFLLEHDGDTQTLIEVIETCVSAYPDEQAPMRFLFQAVLEHDWFLKSFDSVIEEIQDPTFAGECYLNYARVLMAMRAWGSGADAGDVCEMLIRARESDASLPWDTAWEILDGNDVDEELIEEVKLVYGV